MVHGHSDRGTPEGGVVLYEWKHFAGGCAPSATSDISSAQAISTCQQTVETLKLFKDSHTHWIFWFISLVSHLLLQLIILTNYPTLIS